MKLASIHVSKVSALVEITDLVPTGKVFAPDLMTAIAERCEFRKFPQDFGKKQRARRSGFRDREMERSTHRQAYDFQRRYCARN